MATERDGRLSLAARPFSKIFALRGTVFLGPLDLADVDRPGYFKRIVLGKLYVNTLKGADCAVDTLTRGAFDKLYFSDRNTTAAWF